jgi:hypothetical protein
MSASDKSRALFALTAKLTCHTQTACMPLHRAFNGSGDIKSLRNVQGRLYVAKVGEEVLSTTVDQHFEKPNSRIAAIQADQVLMSAMRQAWS